MSIFQVLKSHTWLVAVILDSPAQLEGTGKGQAPVPKEGALQATSCSSLICTTEGLNPEDSGGFQLGWPNGRQEEEWEALEFLPLLSVPQAALPAVTGSPSRLQPHQTGFLCKTPNPGFWQYHLHPLCLRPRGGNGFLWLFSFSALLSSG